MVTDDDIEEKGRVLSSERRGYEDKLKSFKEVMMKTGYNIPKSKSRLSMSNKEICRSLIKRTKRHFTDMQGVDSQYSNLERKKLRAIPLETSTPKSYRNPPAVIDSDPESPVMGDSKQVMSMETSESSSLGGNSSVPQGHKEHAGISQDVCDTLIIDRPRESKSLELRRVLMTTIN